MKLQISSFFHGTNFLCFTSKNFISVHHHRKTCFSSARSWNLSNQIVNFTHYQLLITTHFSRCKNTSLQKICENFKLLKRAQVRINVLVFDESHRQVKSPGDVIVKLQENFLLSLRSYENYRAFHFSHGTQLHTYTQTSVDSQPLNIVPQ